MYFSIKGKACWHVRRLASAFGWLGACAILITAGSIVFNDFTLIPYDKRITSLRHEAHSLSMQLKAHGTSPKVLSPIEQLEAFYRFFPDQNTIPDTIGNLYHAASLHYLSIDQAEYQLMNGRDDRLVRYEVVLPIKGNYVQVRKFVAQALAENPHLSLKDIAFNREKIEDQKLDAQLKFIVFLRDK